MKIYLVRHGESDAAKQAMEIKSVQALGVPLCATPPGSDPALLGGDWYSMYPLLIDMIQETGLL